MSVVVWDGKTLAADMAGSSAGCLYLMRKAVRVAPDEVHAWTGSPDAGRVMSQWFRDGARPEDYPEWQRDEERWCRLIVVRQGMPVLTFEAFHIPIEINGPFAWGAGRDYALGALFLGAFAGDAVRAACKWSDSCGIGVASFDLRDGRRDSEVML